MDRFSDKRVFGGLLRTLINWTWWWMLGVSVLAFLFYLALGLCAALDWTLLSEETLRDISLGWKTYRLDLLTASFNSLGYGALLGVWTLFHGCILYMVYQLRQILRSMDKGTPFTIENATRLRHMGHTVFVGFLVQMPPVFWVLNELLFGKAMASLKIGPSLGSLAPILFGLVLLALAEVFEYGVGLQSERDLTI